jgi:hypothetical protein
MSLRTQYRCGTPERRARVRDADPARGERILNGIDFLEVASDDQRTLEIAFIRPLPGETGGVPGSPALTIDDVVIEGGVRVVDIRVTQISAAENVLTVEVDKAGDFSTYTLRLVAGGAGALPPDGFDTMLSAVTFSFKAGCPSDFDCATDPDCPPESLPAPIIDYLAKDYASFRRLMLDRMRVTMPDWTERNAADLGVTVVELLAYAADHLSYYQDAVATEAYLGTARKRTSLRRHAKLLDYAMHDGVCARTWIAIDAAPGSEGVVVPGPRTIESGAVEDAAGTLFLTRTPDLPPLLAPNRIDEAIRAGAEPFEALHDVTLHPAWSEIRFYTWGDEDCCLPRGATRAFLRNPADTLADLVPGTVLIFEETRGPDSGRPEDADPLHRHAVRLTRVAFLEDELFPDDPAGDDTSPRLRVAAIEWAAADALPFPLCLRELADASDPNVLLPVSAVRGNVVLVEHGRTLPLEIMVNGQPAPREEITVDGNHRFRPRLQEPGIACQGRATRADGTLITFDPDAPAARALVTDARSAVPAVYLRETASGNVRWSAQRDLLDTDAFDREFVAEIEDDGATTLRFGDNVHGALPRPGARFAASYRLGGGRAGNIGADAITHIVSAESGIAGIRNPLPARGGQERERAEHVRLYAPQAFRTQERAVTEADYAAAAEQHPAIQRAAATFRWTGSWHTVFLTVDRKGGLPVDAAFEEDLVLFLERFPLAGYDLEIEPPVFVPLDLAMTVCVEPGVLRSDVHIALLEMFSNRSIPGGRLGFFHPDYFTFGQPVHLSRIVAAAMSVPGVRWVDVDPTPPKQNRFHRFGRSPAGEVDAGVLRTARLEIARLDNDPSLPENGRIEFFMEGGL